MSEIIKTRSSPEQRQHPDNSVKTPPTKPVEYMKAGALAVNTKLGKFEGHKSEAK